MGFTKDNHLGSGILFENALPSVIIFLDKPKSYCNVVLQPLSTSQHFCVLEVDYLCEIFSVVLDQFPVFSCLENDHSNSLFSKFLGNPVS